MLATLEALLALEQEGSWFDTCLVLARQVQNDTGKNQEWTVTVNE